MLRNIGTKMVKAFRVHSQYAHIRTNIFGKFQGLYRYHEAVTRKVSKDSMTMKNQFDHSQVKDLSSESSEFAKFITDNEILGSLQEKGLSKMFPIQQICFPLILEGHDILASDRTGSGKTLAYTLPILESFRRAGKNYSKSRTPKFIILSPTRELALQVTNQIKKFVQDLKIVTVYGGSSMSQQIKQIQRGAGVIVATPGRLIDFMEKGVVRFNDVEAVCLDEADTMLEKGFKLDVERIMDEIEAQAGKTQNMMFSATIPGWVAGIAKKYLKNMKKINLIKEEAVRTSQTIQHLALMVENDRRHEAVLDMIQQFNPNNRTIIFTKTKSEANDFIKHFQNDELVILHGDIPQAARENNLSRFRRGERKVLVATDVAARGLDIPDVELIIQLSPPEHIQPFIHRAGRTGRAGRKGINITFFNKSSLEELIEIEDKANISIKVITGQDQLSVWHRKAQNLIEECSYASNIPENPFYQSLIDELLRKATPEQLVLHFVRKELGKAPEPESLLTKKKRRVAFCARKISQDSESLQLALKGVNIYDLVETSEEYRFDISSSDYKLFEDIANKQDSYDVELFHKEDQLSLRQYRNSLRKGGSRTYEEKRPSYENKSFENRVRINNRQQQLSNKLFIPRIPSDVDQSDLEYEIQEATGTDSFKLKVINKQGEEGDSYKFGFLELRDAQDSRHLLGKGIRLGEGKYVSFRVSSPSGGR